MTCDNEPASPRAEIIPTRQSLLSRLKNRDDSESWGDFFATYWRLIFNIAQKAGLTDTECEDVVQQTVLEVSQKMPEFRYNPEGGSFKAWLLQITRWRIQDQFRKRLPPEVVYEPSDRMEQVIDPAGSALERAWDSEWEKNLFEAALERVKEQVNPRVYQLFDAYVLQEWPIVKICALFNVTASQVRMAKYRISKSIRKELKHLEKKTF
jgi:RNA polymerase sigma factor (sigma-70 family)